MGKRLMKSEFVEDVGVRVGILEKLIALDNYGETLTLDKEHHAHQYLDKALEVGFTKDEATKLLFKASGIKHKTEEENEHSRRRSQK